MPRSSSWSNVPSSVVAGAVSSPVRSATAVLSVLASWDE